MVRNRLQHQHDATRDCSGAAGALWYRPVAAPVLLRTENLGRSFGRLAAVDGVDFEVPAGELRAVIGPNGAGKSTFFKLISGELAPTAGRIVFDGRDITGLPHHAVSRRGIAKSYQIT